MDLRDAIMKMKEAKEKRPRRQIEALQKLSDIFNVDWEKEESDNEELAIGEDNLGVKVYELRD